MTGAIVLPPALVAARAQPVGATWHRVALQVNPFGYEGANAPSLHYPDEVTYNRALVDELTDLGVSMIAVTDHWNVASAQGLIHACTEAGIVALPGFEAKTNSNGAHALVIFPEGTSVADINAAIGACGGIPGGSGLGHDFPTLAQAMSARGAMVIAPHANVASGLLGALTGTSLANAWRSEFFNAVAVSPQLPITQHQRDIIDNRDSATERTHPIAEVWADDICHPDRLGQDGGTCWVKMSSASLGSLQTAVRTPQTRIALRDPGSVPHPRIKAIAWEGGFLDGLGLSLSESMTTLIGGRGTGKSTVIESLRYVMDVPAIGTTAKQDSEHLVKKVLRDGTTVTVLVEATTPARREFLITRRVPDPPVVRDIAGTVLALTPGDVLGPIEIFSQHELAELAEDPRYVAQLLERFAGTSTDAEENEVLFADLAENRNDILKLDQAINLLQDRLDDLPRLAQQLKQFEDAGVADRAREQRDVGRERGLLDQVDRSVTDAAAVLAPLATAAGAVVAPALDGDLPRATIISQALALLQELQGAILTARAGIEEAIDRTRGQLATLRETWGAATADVLAAYADLATALSAEGLDVASYMTLDAKIQTLERQKPEMEGLKTARSALYDKRLQLLAAYRDDVGLSRQRLGEACTAANEHLRNVVVVKPQRSSDRDGLEALVLQQVSGQRSQIMAALRRDDFSPQAFANACRIGVAALEREYDIRGAQATSLLSAGEALFMAIEEQTIPLAAEAMLNVATTGTQYKSLNELSKGQKATALLLMLLIDANTPLFIDQPEDNLDNRFVFDEIVPRLRQLKGQRQLVLSTHNANVPVLGDADLVVAMECVDNTGCVADGGVGSLDDEGVRRLTGILLEGGQAAFAARQHLYGY